MADALGEFQKIDSFVRDLTTGLPIEAGSLCRLAVQAMQNWGINITSENREALKQMSEKSFSGEWETPGYALNDEINRATRMAQLGLSNMELNMHLTDIAAEVISAILELNPSRTVKILDVGAGDCETTQQLAAAIAKKSGETELARCMFYPLEPSAVSMTRAYVKIDVMKRFYEQVHTRPITADDGFLGDIRDNTFDAIISNAALHHKSFPDYLAEFDRVLRDDGVLAIGDWYTAMWYRPAMFILVLQSIGADQHQIGEFKKFFGLEDESRVLQTMESFSESEQRRQACMLEYIKCLASCIASANEENEKKADASGLPRPPRIKSYCIEAHELPEDRIGKLNAAGFETDLGELKRSRPVFRGLGINKRSCIANTPDFAMVMVAGKKARIKA